MPVNQSADFFLNSKPYMLVRAEPFKGRAWQRTGQPDTPSRRSETDAKYGVVEDTLDHPEVWDDWSGGFGQAYRRAGENTYHWAENMDLRFPRQAVHAQELRMIGSVTATGWYGGLQIHDAPIWSRATIDDRSQANVVRLDTLATVGAATDVNTLVILQPTGQRPEGSAFIRVFQNSFANMYTGNGKGVVFGSYYYMPIAADPSYHFWQWDLDSSTGVGAPSLQPAQGFALAGNAMWRYFGYAGGYNKVNSVAAYMNPLATANWSATLNVGNGYYPIVDMISYEDQLLCGMGDGLYAGDQSGSFTNVLSELTGQANKENCRDLVVHDGQVIAGANGGIYAYAPYSDRATVRQILEPNLGNRSPVQGLVRSLRSYGGWLYAGMWTGSATYLLAGQDPVGNGRYGWHTLQRLPSAFKPHRIHFDSITVASGGKEIPNRVWILTDASQGNFAPIYYHPVPRANGNPLLSDPTFSPSYMGSARLDLGIVDWNAPSTSKVFRAVDIWAENLASGAQWVDVYHTIDGGTRTLLGTVAKSPKDSLYFLSTTGSYATGQSIALSLESFTASYGVTPIYRAVVLRGALRPQSINEITAVVRIADNVPDRQGTPLRPGATMIAELRALAVAGTPTQLVDLAGATQQVVVLAPVGEQELYQTGEENPEIAATVKMAVVTFTGG